jgi:hypothetical protein
MGAPEKAFLKARVKNFKFGCVRTPKLNLIFRTVKYCLQQVKIMHIYDSFLKSLSLKERIRHEAALDQYEQIQRSNAVNQTESLTVDDRKFMASMGYDTNAKLITYFHSVARSATSGDELFASSLFRRLLDGKQELPFPPPLSFSFPWYDVIEGSGPWDVVVTGVDECQKLPHLRRYMVNPIAPNQCVLINDYLWRVNEIVSPVHFIVTQPGWFSKGFQRVLKNETKPDQSSCWRLSI